LSLLLSRCGYVTLLASRIFLLMATLKIRFDILIEEFLASFNIDPSNLLGKA